MATTSTDKLGRRIVTSVVLGVVLYAAIALAGDVGRLGDELWAFPPGVFAAAIALSVVNYSLRWAKWHYYLACLDCPVDRPSSVIVFIAGLTMSITPGKVGEVLKSLLLERTHGYPVARTAPIVIAERLTDLLGLFVIAGLGIAVFDYGRLAFALILVSIVAGILMLQSGRAVHVALDLVSRLPRGERMRPRLEEAYVSMRLLIGLRPMLIGTGLAVLSWSMESMAFWWILTALGVDTTLYLAAFVFAMTTILGAVSFLPGGLGVTEGSMIGALLLLKVVPDEIVATTATYLIRLATLWFAVLLGVVGLALYRRRIAADTKPLPP